MFLDLFFVIVSEPPKIGNFPISPKLKLVKTKNEICQTKDLIKRLKKHKNIQVKKLQPLELITCKNTKFQGVMNVRNKDQTIKNLLYFMLIKLESFLAVFS